MRIIIGIYGHVLDQQTKDFLIERRPHGVILFGRNIDHSSSTQAKNLVNNIKKCSNETIVFIDQEGGRIQRMKPPLVEKMYPPANVFEHIYGKDKEAGLQAVYDNYKQLTTNLVIGYGITGIFAPVCDLYHPSLTDVIGDRAFSSDPKIVTDLAIAAIRGIKDGGGLSCIKHVPGHGRAQVDSHLDLPRVSTGLNTLMNTDFFVFAEIMRVIPKLVDYAMTAHIVYDCIDPKLPITTSPQGVKFLREQLKIMCPIMGDDLNMKALQGSLNTVYARTKQAGCDISLICHAQIKDLLEIDF